MGASPRNIEPSTLRQNAPIPVSIEANRLQEDTASLE